MFKWVSCLLLAWLGGAGSALAQESARGRVLVRYRAGEVAGKVRPTGGRLVRRLTGTTHLVEVSDTQAAIDELRRHPDVKWIEPDYIRRRAEVVTPDDQMYPYQWALPLIHAPEAWTRSEGSSSVVVAIVDTGILPHPELASRLVSGYDFISDPDNAGDGDGRDPDPTDAGDASESSSALHGMHVAGVLGAIADNRVGVAGLDWGCRIQPVRVLGVHGGTGLDSDIADAIRWAAGLHVDGVPDNPTPAAVINLSFDGQGKSNTMQEAVDDAIANGATVVAAAGNRAGDAASGSPGGLAGVISVGAIDRTGQRASYSDWGPAVALMAPGGSPNPDANGQPGGILSTLSSPASQWTYAYYAGTSQAAPFVAGTVSLMKALVPELSPEQARLLLLSSADPSARCPSPGDASQPGCGAGLLDVDAALALAAQQPACGGSCKNDQLCRFSQCVSPQAELPAGLSLDNAKAGGCQLARGGSAGAVGFGVPMLLALLALLRRRRATS
jgi:serine protease